MKKVGKAARGSSTGRPIMVLLDILGQRWTLRILWELRGERLTFRELQDRCDNVSPTSLNLRLKQLRHANLVDHNDDGFGFTPWGHELGNQLTILSKWSDEWGESF